MNLREYSFLEEPDDLNVEVFYRKAIQNSVAYMLLSRCGIDPEDFFDPEDFRYVTEFNTSHTLNALGIATSDIAETCLREISATVLTLQRQEKEHRTFATPDNSAHNEPNIQTSERSFNDGSVDIQD